MLEKVKEASAVLNAVAPGELATIIHHYDVYHVEVKLLKELKSHIDSGTKTSRSKAVVWHMRLCVAAIPISVCAPRMRFVLAPTED